MTTTARGLHQSLPCCRPQDRTNWWDASKSDFCTSARMTDKADAALISNRTRLRANEIHFRDLQFGELDCRQQQKQMATDTASKYRQFVATTTISTTTNAAISTTLQERVAAVFCHFVTTLLCSFELLLLIWRQQKAGRWWRRRRCRSYQQCRSPNLAQLATDCNHHYLFWGGRDHVHQNIEPALSEL